MRNTFPLEWTLAAVALAVWATATDAQMMWFQSGFERDCRIIKDDPDLKHGCLAGKDLALSGKNDWKADFGAHPKITSGRMGIACRGTGFDKRNAAIVDDPVGRGQGKVLTFWAKYALEPTDKKLIRNRFLVRLRPAC